MDIDLKPKHRFIRGREDGGWDAVAWFKSDDDDNDDHDHAHDGNDYHASIHIIWNALKLKTLKLKHTN